MHSPEPVAVRVITHNIRYATEHPFEGEEPWSTRCSRLCAELDFHSRSPATTFICLQEVLHGQLLDILAALNDSPGAPWAYIGVGRDDGSQSGEYSPIFYRPSVWELEDYRTLWLSETPEKPSKGWDAACVRVVTAGTFRHREIHKKVVVMSTHLDHEGSKARAEGVKVILRLVDEYQALLFSALPLPLLVAGDFNSTPEDEAYKIMTGEESPMVDVRELVPNEKKYGHPMSFTSFGEHNSNRSLIDFIFSYKTKALLCIAFGILENRFDDGVYLSDHRAVVADFMLPGH